MKTTVVLNSNYTHLTVVRWEKAIKLILKEKVVPVDFYDDYVISAGGDVVFQIPRTVALKTYVKVPYREFRPTRRNIFVRDYYTCRYCGKQLSTEELSVDHVLPKSRGGKETWENLVTSCKPCNSRKGDRTPEEAGIELRSLG